MLLAAAAFAAPLVRFTDKPNPGFNIFGLRGREIDVAAALIGSILGQGVGDAVSEWRLDPPALLKRARLFNDLLFLAGNPVLDGGQIGARQQHERLLRLWAGDARAVTAISSSSMGSQSAWHGIFVTLLPFSHQQFRPVNTTVDTFQSGLCLDNSPAAGASALSDPPRSATAEANPAAAARALRRMSEAAREYYGTPIRAYIRYLVECFDRLPVKIAKLN
jgi:hypothetical protein